jgi:hypothetical protein
MTTERGRGISSRMTLRSVKLALSLVLVSVACNGWTAQDTKVAEDTGKAILCAIEHAELDDPSLNAICGVLTTTGTQALAAHRAAVAKAAAPAARGLTAPCGDGGSK